MDLTADPSSLNKTSTPPPDSSFDQYAVVDDLSAMDIEFFRDVPNLQSPDRLANPDLSYPAFATLEDGAVPAEDADEVDADSQADEDEDDDDFEEESFGDLHPGRQSLVDDDEEEVDQIVYSSPIRPAGSHSASHLPQRAEEVQLGGGYKHREASPLPLDQQPSSRFRGVIKPSARSNNESAALHEIRAKSVKPAASTPPPEAPPMAPILSPAPRAVSAAIPWPPPQNSENPLPRIDLALIHSKARPTPPPYRSTPPPQRLPAPSERPPAAVQRKPLPAHRAPPPESQAPSPSPAHQAPQPQPRPSSEAPSQPPSRPPSQPPSRPPSRPPSEPPSEPQPQPQPSPIRLPFPLPPPPAGRYYYFSSVDLAPPADGYLAVNDYDELERSLDQPFAEASPYPSFEPSATPTSPSHPVTLFDNDDNVEMAHSRDDAPSTAGEDDETRSISTVERADTPRSLSAIDNELDAEEEGTVWNGDDVDMDEDTTVGNGDGVDGGDATFTDTGGRPSRDAISWRTDFLDSVQRLSKAFARDSGIPSERFMKALGNHSAGGWNSWNVYQSFATDPEHAVREYQRIDPSFNGSYDKIPRLSSKQLSAMHSKFKTSYSQGGMGDIILRKYDEGVFLSKGETLASRQRAFEKQCGLFRTELAALEERNQDAIVFCVGSVVSEDCELGEVIATPGLDSFCAAFKNAVTLKSYSSDDLMAVAKTCAYNSRMNKALSVGTVLEVHPKFAASAGPSTSATPSATPSAPITRPSAEASGTSAKVSAASIPAPVSAPAASTSTPAISVKAENVEGGKKFAKDMDWASATYKNLVKLPTTSEDIRWMRGRWSAMSIATIGMDIFRKENAGQFSWLTLPRLLKDNRCRLLGFPDNLHLPGETTTGRAQATGAWRVRDMKYFNLAILEWEKTGNGLRLEHHPLSLTENDFVIVTHDYTIPPPEASQDLVQVYWQTCAGKKVRCVDSEGDIYRAGVDLSNTGSPAIAPVLIQKSVIAKKDGKVAEVAEVNDEEDDEIVEVVRPSRSRSAKAKKSSTKASAKPSAEASASTKPSAASSSTSTVAPRRPRPKPLTDEMKADVKGKGKAKAVEVDVESQDTDNDTPVTARAHGKRKAAETDDEYVEPTTRAPKAKETKRGRTAPAPPASPPASDVHDASDTDSRQPPAKKQKTRADGPASVPAVQQGGGRMPATASAKAPEKQVRFADRPANHPDTVAARRAAMATIPMPEESPIDEHPIGDSRRPPSRSTRSRTRSRSARPPVDPAEPVIPPYSYPSPPPNTHHKGILYSTNGTAVPIGTVFAQPHTGAHYLVDGLSPAPSGSHAHSPAAPAPHPLPPALAPPPAHSLAPPAGSMIVDTATFEAMKTQLASLMTMQQRMQGFIEGYPGQQLDPLAEAQTKPPGV
ncbi:hypothetical protein R3P38DRAFT_2811906 [Favolaschia claudopus]|uniref:Uncharacterized protein n=1 Tax=Favolaschia claudopus TaxID=2862362 RepID=A0AAV9Z8S9_9AGAR